MRLLLALLLLCATPLRADTLVVFAAASLGGALDEVAETFDGDVTISYAGSATLARQIEAGAPADVVILANAAWMDHLANRTAITGAPRNILSNTLVLAVPAGSRRELDPTDPLAPFNRIATGLTEAVPLGIYTRQALENLDAWDSTAPRLVQTENARLALALVARGDVDAGFVYNSDAIAEPAVEVQIRIRPETHSPIRYPAAITTRSRNPETASAFINHLLSPESLETFLRHGYEPPP